MASSTNVGSIHYDLKLDTKNFDKNSQSASKNIEGFGSKLKKLTKNVALAGAAIAGVGFGLKKGFIDPASDLNETINKVDVAFGKNAKEVKDWSKTTIEQFGIAGSTAMEAASLFGDMGTSMGLNTERAADMSTSLTGLAGDLASFKNIDIEQATTALAGVFTGETESLKRLGVVMTQANLELFAMEKGIGKTIDEMSQAEKVNLRYEYILSKTKNAQGDFARTSEGAANQTRMTGERIKELREQIGAKLIPAYLKAVEFTNDLINKFQEWQPTIERVATRIADVARKVSDYLLPKFKELWSSIQEDLMPVLRDLWDSYLKDLVKIIGTTLVVAIGVFVDALNVIVENIDLLMPVLAGFGTMLLGAKVLGAINAVKLAIVSAGGLKAAMVGFAGWLKTATLAKGALINPWVLFAAAAVTAFVAIQRKGKQTEKVIADVGRKVTDTTRMMQNQLINLDRDAKNYEQKAQILRNALAEQKRIEQEMKQYTGVSGFFKEMFRFADGGRPPTDRVSLVGEEGPELFIPDRPGTIVPNGQSMDMMSGTTTSIYGNINIQNKQDADYFLQKFTRNNELLNLGMSEAGAR